MASFWTSDFHFGHEKILTMGKGRPFDTIEEMNRWLLASLNAVAGPNDTLYFLGDWCCGIGPDKINYIRRTRAQIKVGTIHFIRGNHDPSVVRLRELVEDGTLASVQEMLTIRAPESKRELVMCHYPLEDWEFESAATMMIHGHRHGNGVRNESRLRLDIGVDGHHYKPWSWDELKVEMESKPWEEKSHHA